MLRKFDEKFCRFSPFNFQEKWPQEISLKILHMFHEWQNKILSLRDSGRGVPQTLEMSGGFRCVPPRVAKSCAVCPAFAHLVLGAANCQLVTWQGYPCIWAKWLSVNSPALILSKNSGVSLAKIGKKSAKNRLKIGSRSAKFGGFRFTAKAQRFYAQKLGSICHFSVLCLLAYGDIALKS